MSDNIYKEKFISHRVPAWHRLGEVTIEQLLAADALNRMGGYVVEKFPMYVAIPGVETNTPLQTGSKKALVARFANEDKFLGICDSRYDIMQPKDVAQVWDMVTESHVETMGVLNEGQDFFFSTKLPSYDVKGDQCDNYLLVHSPCVPGRAATVTITPVRVVCQNTLSYGLGSAKSQHRIVHVKGAINRYGAFLKEAWETATVKAQAVKEAMEIMASVRVPSINDYVESVFPYPVLDNPADFEAAKDRTDAKREEVVRLFEGGAQGAETEAFKGTLFGAYNSVVEFVDYFSRMNKNSVVFGGGANLKQSAFDVAMATASR